jgi:hypothetical protein
MAKRAAIMILAAAFGTGSAVALAACGEDREGEVEFETEGTGTAGTETAGTETTGTETTATETTGTETAPETETESETETTP